MKALRLLLLLLVFFAGAAGLVALVSEPRFDWMDIAVFSGFWAFLFALTLLLKIHAEHRTIPGHRLNSRPFGWFFLCLGIFSFFYGLSFYVTSKALPDGSGTCQAICGLILVMVQLFGESVARFAAFALWAGVGMVFCLIGYQGLRRA